MEQLVDAAKVGDAVHDVQGQPADGEEGEDQSQGLGQVLLLQVVCAAFRTAGRVLLQALPDIPEDPGVDEDHRRQRGQDAAEEVEVDHVGHFHHVCEPVAAGTLQSALVPAEERSESQHARQQPAQGHGNPGTSLGDYSLVTAQK